MHWPLPRLLLLATLLGSLGIAAAAQTSPEASGTKSSGAKTSGAKQAEPKKVDSKKADPKKAEPQKVEPEKANGLSGPIVVPAKDVEKVWPSWPGMLLIRPDVYQEKLDQIAALKQKLKTDKTLAHSCELTGRLEGDYVALRGEFAFATETPRTTVILGLQGAQLTEKGELDGQTALMDYGADEGFTARVEDAGNHRLILHLRVPVTSKRPTGGGGPERGFDLGLPGTAITTLALDLPPGVKEVRWNDGLEKHRVQGKWFFALGKKQALSVGWREPAPLPGGGPHLSVDGTIKVRLVDDAHTELSAELVLVDPRGQTKECQLVLPPQADVKVDAPPGVPFELVPPGPKNPYHVLRFPEPNAERWTVTAFVNVLRPAPGGRLPVGPYYVLGAEHQRGTITILAAAELLRKQRLIYHRYGEVFQRDPPKVADLEAVFQYWGLPNPTKGKAPGSARVPLELEIKSERGPLEMSAETILKLRPSAEGSEIDLTARLHVKSPFGGGDYLELQLPRPRLIGLGAVAAAPGVAFPATLPWAGLARLRGPMTWAVPLEFQVSEEGRGLLDLPSPDAHGRCRVPLPRGLGKGFTLTLTGKYAVGAANARVRIGLPRVLGLTEQGSKITVQADETVELLVGERGFETPVPDKHRYQIVAEESPTVLDLAWRSYRPDYPADAVIDVVIHDRSAQVRQQLMFGPPPRPGAAQLPRTGQVQLEVPAAIRGLTRVRGDRRTTLPPEKGMVWVSPEGDELQTVVVEYDLALSEQAGANAAVARNLELVTVWPRLATRRSAKVRVWCGAGTQVRPARVGSEAWRDRGVEAVPGHDMLPALVLRGDGAQLPLTLRLEENADRGVAALVCDHALIRAELHDDQVWCRARYRVQKVGAEAVEIEFPMPVAQGLVHVRAGSYAIAWEAVPTARNSARIPLKAPTDGQPFILDLEYKLPAATQEGRRLGLTTLIPPGFRQTVVVEHVRWQLCLPTPTLAVPVTTGAWADYRWGLHGGWLFGPEPSASGADLEAWLGSAEPVASLPVSVSFWPAGPEPQRVIHQSRLVWMLVGSGTLLALFLGLFFLRIARLGLLLVLGLLGLGVVALGLTWPALVPALLFGIQPAMPVILLVLGVNWLLQERYRRQLVFIPGFTRVKGGSSLILPRQATSSKRPRDASTIDAPAPSGVVGPAPSSMK